MSKNTGFKPEELSGLVLEIVRDNDYIPKKLPENEYQLELAKYRSKMAEQIVKSAAQDTVKLVENIDEETSTKHGVSHDVKYVIYSILSQS